MKKIIFISLLTLNLLGCLSTERTIPQQYAFDVQKPTKLYRQPKAKVLEINNVTAVSQFSSFNFIYRVSAINYLTDYYNIFFAPPAQQINKIMIDYLRAKNIFSYVANDAGQLKINYILYPEITALYADYRDSKQPQAVIALDCTLFSTQKNTAPLMHKLYTAKVPLAAKDSDSLMRAWNQGLKQILSDLSVDLARI